jgi:hypothetical protein
MAFNSASSLCFYRKKQLPIIDDFDLNVIDDGQAGF